MATGGQTNDYKCDKEWTNYARLCRAIIDLCSQVLRDVLNRQIQPKDISDKVKNCQNLKKLNPSQFGILSSASLKKPYAKCDITLLYAVIRNHCPSIKPTVGWGLQHLPPPSDTAEGDDVERIRLIRNEMYGHAANTRVNDSVFHHYWQVLQEVMSRMDKSFGPQPSYSQRLTSIENDNMDEATKRMYIEKIKELAEEIQQIKQETAEDRTTLSQELKDIEKRTLKRLERQLSSNTFVQTQAVTKGKQILDENKILIYTGLPGEGKTENALCVLNLLRQESQNDIYIKLDSLSEWKYVDPDFNLVILLDDCFGKTNANSSVINDEKWRGIEACIKEGKVRLILTIRKHIFVNNCTKLENNGTELFMKKNVIDLSTEGFCLTKENKKEILLKHCQSRNIEICDGWNENLALADQAENNLKISQYTLNGIVKTDCAIGFPYTCYLFFSHPKYTKQGTKFFRKPLEQLKINISELVSSNSDDLQKTQYCLMCYMMLKGGDINLKNLDQNMLDNIIKSLKINEPSERERKEAIENLNHIYVVGDFPIFSFKHQTILECVALCFADDNTKLLLQLCSNNFISEFIRPTDYQKKDGEEIIRLDQNDYIHLIKRLIKYLQENDVHDLSVIYEWWATHPLLDDKQFVNSLIDEIKSHELMNGSSLCVQRLFHNDLFIYACKFGYTYFIKKLHDELHVEVSNIDTGLGLQKASERGHTETVMWLLNLNIDTDNVIRAMAVAPTDTLASIINHQYVKLNDVKKAFNSDAKRKVCHYKTFDVLLNKWPDMELEFVLKLLNACIDYDNDKAAVSLITRKSDEIQPYMSVCINKACYEGFFKVLKSIINEMPHIKTKQVLNESFTWACAGGHLEIVDYLLGLNDNDIDKKSIYLSDNDMNITNLHVAAYFGNFEILRKLIAIGVDVYCKSKTKKSVLSYAIEGYGKKSGLVTTNNEIINLLYCSLHRTNDSFVYNLRYGTYHDYRKVLNCLLILDGINLNDLDFVLDKHGNNFAHYCTLNNDKKTIELLLNKYETVLFSKTSEGLTCLHIAAFNGHVDIFELLVKAGLSIKDRDKLDRSVMQYAIMGYKYNYNQLDHKEDTEISYINKRVLHECRPHDRRILTDILQSSDVNLKDLDILDNHGMALVHYCAIFNDVVTIELLHSCYKQSVFVRTNGKMTCLHIATFFGKHEAFKALVNAGLSIKDEDKEHKSVLHYAIIGYKFYSKLFFYESRERLYQHIDDKTDIERRSFPFELKKFLSVLERNYFDLTERQSILLYILRNSDVSLEELEIYGIVDKHYSSLVQYVVLFRNVEIIKIFIERCTKSVFLKTYEGLAGLHIAAFCGKFDVFEILVKAGLSLKGKELGMSVLQYAIMGYIYNYTKDDKDIESTLIQEISHIIYLEEEEKNRPYTLNHILQSSDVSLEEISMLDKHGMALVHYCVSFNDVATIDLLVSIDKKYVYRKTQEGLTCLHIAAFLGNLDLFEVLVKAGLSTKALDPSGISVLQYANMGRCFAKGDCEQLKTKKFKFTNSLSRSLSISRRPDLEYQQIIKGCTH